MVVVLDSRGRRTLMPLALMRRILAPGGVRLLGARISIRIVLDLLASSGLSFTCVCRFLLAVGLGLRLLLKGIRTYEAYLDLLCIWIPIIELLVGGWL